MACCEGSCGCGKGDQSPVEKNLHLLNLSAGVGMLPAFDWRKGPDKLVLDDEVVEIRFKNNRKIFFRNRFGLSLSMDDRVVVEAEGGHDIGIVSLTGNLAEKRYQQKRGDSAKNTLRKVHRIATKNDTYNWLKTKKREREVCLEARNIALSRGLEISINDVEFRGDGRRVTIYYRAGGRINFHELTNQYVDAFRVSVVLQLKAC